MSARTDRDPEVSASGPTEVWQARIPRPWAFELLADAAVLGIESRTDIVRAGLTLLHRQAAEVRMAQDIEAFYGSEVPPLPIGVSVGG